MSRAVRFDHYGGVEVLEVVDVDPPTPGPGQLLVRVRAAGINLGEAKIRQGLLHDLWPSTFPSGQGSDLAGVVEQVGPAANGFKVGDEVLGFTHERSSQAELVVVEPDHVIMRPPGVDWNVAGSLFVVGTTAYAAVRAVRPVAGETIVVAGAAGGVGSIAVQLARRAGASVLGIAGEHNHEWLREHGVVPVAYGTDTESRVRDLSGGRVDAFIDTVGDGYVELALKLGISPDRIDTIADFAAAERDGVKAEGNRDAATVEVLAELADLISRGELDVPVAGAYPLEHVREAYRELERRHTRGKIVLTFSDTIFAGPGEERYEAGRAAFNVIADQRPAHVALPGSDDDVVSAVQFAVQRGLKIAPQRTGHAATTLGALENTVLIRTDRLTGVEIDPAARTARVQGGARWADVVPAAAEVGLAALHGASPTVGIVGYTLTGGLGWYSRKHGLAANQVNWIELVTADGQLRHVDSEHEPDLFWALRGGGRGFGVVTGLEFGLFALPEIQAGALFWPWERTVEVMHAWNGWVTSVPDELTSVVRVLQFPPIPQIPEPLRGNSYVLVEVVYLGSDSALSELLAPFRQLGPAMDTVATVGPAGIGDLHMDPQEPVPFTDQHQLLTHLPTDAVDQLVSLVGPRSGSPLLSFEIRHLGGALARGNPEHGALDTVPGTLLTFGVGLTPGAEAVETVREHLRKVGGALAPYDAGYGLPGFTMQPADPSRFYDEATVARLAGIRSGVDPDGVFS